MVTICPIIVSAMLAAVVAPEMLVRPYTLREAARGQDRGKMRPRQR
jgi:hypothetical protein